MTTNIRVMIVEDHPDYREGVRFALETEQDFELYATFGTAERALQSISETKDKTELPNVILLDLMLPGMSGIEAIPLFKKHTPDTHLLVLSQSEKESDVLRAISMGASGYLLKNASLNTIIDGIRTVMAGGASLDSKIAKYILNSVQKQRPDSASAARLTKREMQVIQLISEGQVKKQISHSLGISPPTVATHVRHIYEKLGVSNAPSAISKAYRTGLLPPE
jgi:DNA-binding NarL/FixJ family response regulator